MRMEISQSLKAELQQKLTPQLLQSIKILQLSSLDLEQFLKEEMEQNPTLELVEPKAPDEEISSGEEAKPFNEEKIDSPLGGKEDLENDFSHLESLSEAFSDYYPTYRSSFSSEEDKKMEALQNTATNHTSLYDHLIQQLHLLDISKKMERIGEEIIYNLDHRGYLPYSLEDIQKSLEPEMDLTLEEVEKALKLVQTLDPPGIGARNLKECLLLQLGDHPQYSFERQLIQNHLEDIEKNKLPTIAKKMGEDLELVKEAVSLIRQLDPSPGAGFGSAPPQYIYSDIIVEEGEEGFEVRVVKDHIPHVSISPRYQKMYEENKDNPEVRKFVKKKLEAAKWILESLEQRNKTLYNIAKKIVDEQEEFLRYGVEHLKPMTMQEVAESLGLHISTVSRATSGKYMQTPQGILPMSYFFSRGSHREDGEVESTISIKNKIVQLIEKEDKKNPLSDDQIAEILKKEDGLNIARRTISKYRKQMNIPSSRQRKIF